MSDPYVTKGGIEIHKPKLFLLTGKTSKGNPTRKWQIVGEVENAAGDWVRKPSFVDAATAAKYGGEKKATKKVMATPKARKSCKAKAEEALEKCEAKTKAKSKAKSKSKAKAKTTKKSKKDESEEEEEEEEEVSSSEEEGEELEENEDEDESSEPTPKAKTPKSKGKAKGKGKGKSTKAKGKSTKAKVTKKK